MTSSSLEVLAGLALSTQEYIDLMIFKDGKPSEFYKSYVRDIQAKIVENASAEFVCIWKEHQRLQGAKARTIISDELSSKLNDLQAELEDSDLFDDVARREGVIRRAVPKTLVEKVGLEELLKRLPETYQRALFSSWVASHFVRCFLLLWFVITLWTDDGFVTADLQVWREWLFDRLLPLCQGPRTVKCRALRGVLV